MRLSVLEEKGRRIAEIIGSDKEIRSVETITELMEEARQLQVSHLLANRALIDESFFDLKSGFAGRLAARLSEYGQKLAVVGEFNFLESLALKAYIQEKKLKGQVYFDKSRERALNWLSKA